MKKWPGYFWAPFLCWKFWALDYYYWSFNNYFYVIWILKKSWLPWSYNEVCIHCDLSNSKWNILCSFILQPKSNGQWLGEIGRKLTQQNLPLNLLRKVIQWTTQPKPNASSLLNVVWPGIRVEIGLLCCFIDPEDVGLQDVNEVQPIESTKGDGETSPLINDAVSKVVVITTDYHTPTWFI